MSKKEITIVDEQALAELDALYPKEINAFTRIQLPRIAYAAQDVMEGTGKNKVCVTEAGTFSLETQSDDVDENNKKIWKKIEIGKEMEGIICYHRYQLSYYDQANETFTSSPIYDDKEEVIPLWSNKAKVAEGTPAKLKAMYEYVDPKDGKTKSNLKENRIVYILYNDQLHQLSLHGSSMFSFMTYARNVNPAKYLTTFGSESKTQGTIAWNMMTFKATRPLDNDEVLNVIKTVKEIKVAIAMEKGQKVLDVKHAEDEDAKFIAIATGK